MSIPPSYNPLGYSIGALVQSKTVNDQFLDAASNNSSILLSCINSNQVIEEATGFQPGTILDSSRGH